MEPDLEDYSEAPQEDTSVGGVGSSRTLVIGVFAAGVVAGGALTVGLWLLGRAAMERLELGDSRPRRMRIGNLEIEERGPGHERRFHVQ